MKIQNQQKERLNAWISTSTLSLIKIYAATKNINLSEATEEVIKAAIGHMKTLHVEPKKTDLRTISGIIKAAPKDLSQKHDEYRYDNNR